LAIIYLYKYHYVIIM